MKLTQVARVIRSKNAGPFELTLDIIFEDTDLYQKAKERDLINSSVIAKSYGIPEEQVSKIIYFDPALAVKVVFPRKIASGSMGDHDVYGAQQHAPLLDLLLDL